MIKDLAWKAFKNTGNINTFLELKEIEKLQNNLNNGIKDNLMYNNIEQINGMNMPEVKQDGNNKNKWNNNF